MRRQRREKERASIEIPEDISTRWTRVIRESISDIIDFSVTSCGIASRRGRLYDLFWLRETRKAKPGELQRIGTVGSERERERERKRERRAGRGQRWRWLVAAHARFFRRGPAFLKIFPAAAARRFKSPDRSPSIPRRVVEIDATPRDTNNRKNLSRAIRNRYNRDEINLRDCKVDSCVNRRYRRLQVFFFFFFFPPIIE